MKSPERFYWPHLAFHTMHRFIRAGRPIAAFRALARVARRDFGEQCQNCGRGYLLWWVYGGMWERLLGRSSGTLCPRCFTAIAAKAGLTLQWCPEVFASSDPTFHPTAGNRTYDPAPVEFSVGA